MAEYDNTNSGALFRNDKCDNPKRPDYRGELDINGTAYRISGWVKESKKDGSKFLSLKAEPKEAPAPKAPAKIAPAVQDFGDDIDF